MKTIKLGVLGIVNDKNELVAIVHHNESTRSQVFYTTEECGIEQIEELLADFSKPLVYDKAEQKTI